MKPIALTIAGSDPSGGAGIQADLKTFHQFGVYGQAVITLLTVQNTQNVFDVQVLKPGFVVAQIQAILDDIPPQAAKTGALGTVEVVEAVADMAQHFTFPLVVDPVMISKHGAPLIAAEARTALLEKLLPHARLVMPNLHEAAALTGLTVETRDQMEAAARSIFDACGCNVLVKGGHLAGVAMDLLLLDGKALHEFPAERIDTLHTHGTGCTYSAAVTAGLALGLPLPQAVRSAKEFITEAIRTNPGLGQGCGPVNHHARNHLYNE
ncbi:bifunctional hydroxymethylpyrimidine kinase/phosphomethylpyrimidine kinase [Paludibaculum fermentans]|uniref:bifunctional hydroxymethylpyrimidine kinase/phosphomethylpyrimidine kinase n=1 Tax=Paludibaculum fermentans TaxID=1473598 RepID=UPI003EBBF223